MEYRNPEELLALDILKVNVVCLGRLLDRG